jgi:hypothetical protein
MPRDFKARLAIGDENGTLSAVWVVFTTKDEIYAAHRTSGKKSGHVSFSVSLALSINKAGGMLFDRPRRREAAFGHVMVSPRPNVFLWPQNRRPSFHFHRPPKRQSRHSEEPRLQSPSPLQWMRKVSKHMQQFPLP